MDLIDNSHEMTHIKKLMSKLRATKRYNSRVVLSEMKEDGLVLKHIVAPTRFGNLFPNREGAYMVGEILSHGTYKLEEINGDLVPKTWNSDNLRHYYS